MPKTVRLKKTIIQTVQAAQIKRLVATLDDGSQIDVTGPVSIGDYNIVEPGGESSILSAADFTAELVTDNG